ncbi:MAG: hypothetical protein PHI12_13625 [Dehalococcoidales bacterium]|nr:hypothetical protein [Dehalococcoidales bacterium]
MPDPFQFDYSFESERRWNIIYAVAFILLIVFTTCAIAFVFSSHQASANAYNLDRDQFLDIDHTCPSCGWEGKAGVMTMVVQQHGGHAETLFFCPECGHYFGKWEV